MSDMMSSALSALNSYQAALATTSNNIANANTPGYSQEVVKLAAITLGSQTSQTGSGVSVSSVQRQYDQAINDQLNGNNASFNQQSTLYTMASQVQTAISDNGSGINSAMGTFFNTMQTVAAAPTNLTARTSLLANAQSLVSRFQDVSSQFDNISNSVNGTVMASVSQLNALSTQVAHLNESIASAMSGSNKQPPNALLDQRDAALTSISKVIGNSATTVTNGMVNVYIGNGQPLVIGTQANNLSTQAGMFIASQPDIVLNGAVMTDSLQGGSLGGALAFRQQILEPAASQLGIVATALASQINIAQTTGVDLNGSAGVAMFNQPTPTLQSSRLNTGNAIGSASITSLAQLDGSDYKLQFSASQWQVSNLATGATVTASGNGSAASPLQFAGLSLTFTGTPAVGDAFLLKPTANAASNIKLMLTTGTQVAAGLPDALNGSGDNRNMANMTAVETRKTLFNNSNNLNDAMGNLLGQVATATSNAHLNSESQSALLQSTTARQQAISGVSLDQEAGNLMQYQQAYQAAAQVFSISNNIFNTLLSAFRGA